jgi:hypothetical protein
MSHRRSSQDGGPSPTRGARDFRIDRLLSHRRERGRADRTLAAIRTNCIVLCLLMSATPSLPAESAEAGSPVTLEVSVPGGLPGFSAAELSRYVTFHMAETHLFPWRFAPVGSAESESPDRVEWTFQLGPYAGGGVRSIVPVPERERLWGVHRPVAIEVRLYLDGNYQTAVFGQATIEVGDGDHHLAHAVMQLTQALLGESGAYRSIEVTPPSHNEAAPIPDR